MNTETVTRYVVRHNGRILATTNAYTAKQGHGQAEQVTVPAAADVKALLAEIGVSAARCDDMELWGASAGYQEAHRLARKIKDHTGWYAWPSPSGGYVWFKPTTT
jgi:hypothetical protein